MEASIFSSDEDQDPYHNSSESDVDYIPPVKKKASMSSSKILDYFKSPKPSTSTSIEIQGLHSNKVPKNDEGLVPDPNAAASSSTAIVDHIEKCKNSPMLDGKIFLLEKCDEKMHVEALCQLCLPSRKMIKGSVESTTNFVKHLKRVHGNKSYNDYVKYREIMKSSKGKAKGASDAIIPAVKRSKQGTLKRFVHPKGVVTQKEFDTRIINLIVNTMSAVSLIENQSFIRLFDGMNVKVLGRKAAMRLITDMFNSHVENLKKDIQKQDFVCCTADIWSTKSRSFMGVTLHWIDANLDRKSVALACKRFSGTHDYKNIGEMLENIYLIFGIKSTQIFATVTDNGSNFVKAFRELSVGETQDLQREAGRTHDGIAEDEDDDGDETNEYDEEITFQEIDVSDNSESRIILSTHARCASHTLNLIATTDCKKAIQSNITIRTRHTERFSKCNILWTKAGRPKTAEIIKEVLGHTLSYPGATRWNSYYDSVLQISCEKEKLPSLFQRLNVKYFKETELQYLEEYCMVFKPLVATLDVLQGQQCVYYGYLRPSLLSLRNKWEKLKLQKLSSSGEFLLKTCMQSLERRFSDILNLSSEEAIISAIVHPKFKLRLYNVLKNPDFSMDAMKKMVIGAAEKLTALDNCEELGDAEGLSDTTPDGFFDFNEPEHPSKQATQTQAQSATENEAVKPSKIELEVYKYLDEKKSCLTSLNDYPIIKKVFLRYNTCLPSSAPVERLFSFASIVNSPRRNALTDDNFEKLAIMKANSVNQ